MTINNIESENYNTLAGNPALPGYLIYLMVVIKYYMLPPRKERHSTNHPPYHNVSNLRITNTNNSVRIIFVAKCTFAI